MRVPGGKTSCIDKSRRCGFILTGSGGSMKKIVRVVCLSLVGLALSGVAHAQSRSNSGTIHFIGQVVEGGVTSRHRVRVCRLPAIVTAQFARSMSRCRQRPVRHLRSSAESIAVRCRGILIFRKWSSVIFKSFLPALPVRMTGNAGSASSTHVMTHEMSQS